jgi:hypothetical protein
VLETRPAIHREEAARRSPAARPCLSCRTQPQAT